MLHPPDLDIHPLEQAKTIRVGKNKQRSSELAMTNPFQQLGMKESLPTAVRFHSTALASGDQHFQGRSATNAIAKG